MFLLGVFLTALVLGIAFFATSSVRILKIHGLVRSKAKDLAAKIED